MLLLPENIQMLAFERLLKLAAGAPCQNLMPKRQWTRQTGSGRLGGSLTHQLFAIFGHLGGYAVFIRWLRNRTSTMFALHIHR